MKIKKSFSLTDQNNFASFSGDYNPIHLDEIESIKTHAGQPIVHGVHLVLWALNSLEINISSKDILKINFFNQVNLNTEVEISFNKEGKEILIISTNGDVTYCRIVIISMPEYENNVKALSNEEVFFKKKLKKPEDKEISEIEINKKDQNLFGGSNKKIGSKLFPYLVKKNGLNFVYEFACISSIVGMKIPGKHSLFLELKLSFLSTRKDNYIVVKQKHEVLKVVSIFYEGININAEIKSLFRPKPTKVLSYTKLDKDFRNKISILNKKVLVIGGSRGIGAYVTKLSAIFGARVTFTYKSQTKEAKVIAAEINKNGGQANAIRFDVIKDTYDLFLEDFDYIYYFATPKIQANNSSLLDQGLVSLYELFYVDSYQKIVQKFNNPKTNTFFLYPSTTYLDDKKNGFSEYINAKSKGENLCKELNKKIKGKIIYPRIPPLDTDQNLSIIPSENNRTSEYAFFLISSVIASENEVY